MTRCRMISFRRMRVENPVINKPFEEPQSHWVYRGSVPEKVPLRRSAQYWYQSRRTGAIR